MSGNGAEVLLRQLSSSLARWCHAKRKKSSLSPTKTVETKSTRKIRFLKSHSIPWNVGTTKNANLGEVLGCASHGNRGSNVTLNNNKRVASSSDRRSFKKFKESIRGKSAVTQKVRDCNSCQSEVKRQVTNYESSLGRWWCNA